MTDLKKLLIECSIDYFYACNESCDSCDEECEEAVCTCHDIMQATQEARTNLINAAHLHEYPEAIHGEESKKWLKDIGAVL